MATRQQLSAGLLVLRGDSARCGSTVVGCGPAALRWLGPASLLSLSLCLVGCGKARHESAVRERAQQLIEHLCRGETDVCLAYADPVYVRAQGTNGTKIAFGIMGALLKLGQHTKDTVRIDEVTVADDCKTATVRISLSDKGQWKSLNPSKWVRADGQWYITF